MQAERVNISRRRFVLGLWVAGAGLSLGMYLPGPVRAQTATEINGPPMPGPLV